MVALSHSFLGDSPLDDEGLELTSPGSGVDWNDDDVNDGNKTLAGISLTFGAKVALDGVTAPTWTRVDADASASNDDDDGISYSSDLPIGLSSSPQTSRTNLRSISLFLAFFGFFKRVINLFFEFCTCVL